MAQPVHGVLAESELARDRISMVGPEKRASVALDRRTSTRSVNSTTELHASRRSSRVPVGIAPMNHSRHFSSRPSLLASSLGLVGALGNGEGKSPRRSGVSASDELQEAEFERPSPTAMRLRSLARSVRAAHTLGTLKIRKKYLASSPMAAAGTVTSSSDHAQDGETTLVASRKSGNTLAPRVIVLPTNEFSTDEMKYRLDPLDPTEPVTGSWDVNGVLDVLSTNTSTQQTQASHSSPRVHSSTVLPSARVGSAGSTKTNIGNGGATMNSKARWKNMAAKTIHNNTTGSASNNAQNPPSPLLRRGSARSKLPKRSSSSIVSDHASLLSMTGLADASLADLSRTKANLEARLCCARSLYKLSCQAGSELSIIQGGAIGQIAEFSDIDHADLHEVCAATLANLTAEPSAIDEFVAMDGIPALLELCWSPSITVKLFCVTALCRLSCRAVHAAALAKCRASIEFVSMMSLPSEKLQKLAICCIVNLIFYGHSFPDRIFLGEPHAIQNQLGILSITTQLAMSPHTMQFAAEVLFNLALYRTSCSGALRGGGADILHGLATHTSRALEEQLHPNLHGTQAATPRIPIESAMSLLRLIAHTLANFSSHIEFHAMMSTSAMKTLSLLLVGPLRDLGTRFYDDVAEERLRVLAVPCSRALANLSSNEEIRKQAYTSDFVQLTTRLFLVNRVKLFALSTNKQDEQSFALNTLRAIVNMSFCEPCAAQFMEFTDVMPRLTRIVLTGNSDPDYDGDERGDGYSTSDSDDFEEGEDEQMRTDVDSVKASRRDSSVITPDLSNGSHVSVTIDVRDQMKEDALIAILNLAHQGAYSHELLKHLDGKQLARAAQEQDLGTRLKYIYDVVLSNILFESRLQQIVYGDLVVNSLVDGFYFFSPSLNTCPDPFNSADGCQLASSFKAANLAFPDDQERFLSAICTIAGELMDPSNIERLVAVALDCIRPMDPSMPRQLRKRRKHITCYASGILYSLARSSAHRGHTSNRIYSDECVDTLIAVCERNPTPVEVAAPTGAFNNGTATYCPMTQAFCAATLYQICASGHCNRRVIQALISACNSNEESLSLLACAAAFAIISFTLEGRQQLVASEDLAKALNRLGRTSQVECQQYAAIAACNVSTLQCIWTSNELKDFIVVALLRANSVQAKQIHAKSLANLLSHIKTRAKAVEDGVLYALMKLSQVMASASYSEDETGAKSPATASSTPARTSTCDPMDEVFHLGLQVLFNLSCEHQYHQKLMGNGVMSYLAAAVMPGKQSEGKEHARVAVSTSTLSSSGSTYSLPLTSSVSTESRRYAMGIVCNLTSYESNHKELMNAQVVDIIRSYVDHDVETRASAAMAVRNLSCRQPWVEMICERRTLQMMISFSHCDHSVVRHFAIQTLANCSQVTDSLHLFSELKVSRAVMSVLESTHITQPKAASSLTKINPGAMAISSQADTRETSMAALKCLHNIAADDALAQNLMNELAILRLLPLMESGELANSEEACLLAANTISVLARKPRCAEPLLKQRVVGFCALLHRRHPLNVKIAYECSAILMNMSTYQPIQTSLAETQAIQVLVTICSSPCSCADNRIRECGAIAIRNLTLCVTEHLSLFYDEGSFDTDEPVSSKTKHRRRNQMHTTHPPIIEDKSEPATNRLVERHLLHGVQYFQNELQRFLPDPQFGEHEIKCSSTERVLLEACSGIANLSTVKSFRVAMVSMDIIPSLLRIFQVGHNSQLSAVPPIVRSICSATLHRLALEEDACVDGHGLLVPSLLEILEQRDEELHQVRYECEKVSFPSSTVTTCRLRSSQPATSPPRTLQRTGSLNRCDQDRSRGVVSSASSPTLLLRANSDLSFADMPPAALIATTTCVKQTYREPKWVAYIVKTMLSSATMVPQLEKKQIRSIGLPKLSFFDTDATNLFVTSPPTPPKPTDSAVSPSSHGGDDSSMRRKGGYLMPVHMDKFTSHLTACLQESALSMSMDARSQQLASARSTTTSLSSDRDGNAQDRESLVHSRKFDRHMRLTRRNHRRTNVLPVLSFM